MPNFINKANSVTDSKIREDRQESSYKPQPPAGPSSSDTMELRVPLPILGLPSEIHVAIMSHLDPVSSLKLGLTNRYFYGLHWEKHGPIGLDTHFCKSCPWKGLYHMQHSCPSSKLKTGDKIVDPFIPMRTSNGPWVSDWYGMGDVEKNCEHGDFLTCFICLPRAHRVKVSDVFDVLTGPMEILSTISRQKQCHTCRRYKPAERNLWGLEKLDRLLAIGTWPKIIYDNLRLIRTRYGYEVGELDLYQVATGEVSHKSIVETLVLRNKICIYMTRLAWYAMGLWSDNPNTCRRCKALIMISEFHSPWYNGILNEQVRLEDCEYDSNDSDYTEIRPFDTVKARKGAGRLLQLRNRQAFGQTKSGAWSQEIGEVSQQYNRQFYDFGHHFYPAYEREISQHWVVGHSTVIDQNGVFEMLDI